MKKCPPGMFCLENVSFLFVIFCFVIICYLLYINAKQNNPSSSSEKIIIQNNNREKYVDQNQSPGIFSFLPSWPYNNLPLYTDPLINPYAPPLRDERYFIPSLNVIPNGAVPINVSTNIGAVDTTYRQLGILNATNAKGKILPLMGRPIFTNRDKFQYYTISDQHNSVKLPIKKHGRNCINEYGCDRIYSGDIVYVEGLDESYKVTMYESSTIKYLPFL